MKRYIAFYADKVWGDYDYWPPSQDIPEGSYMYSTSANVHKHPAWWYHDGAWAGVKVEDVPNTVRAMVLVMT